MFSWFCRLSMTWAPIVPFMQRLPFRPTTRSFAFTKKLGATGAHAWLVGIIISLRSHRIGLLISFASEIHDVAVLWYCSNIMMRDQSSQSSTIVCFLPCSEQPSEHWLFHGDITFRLATPLLSRLLYIRIETPDKEVPSCVTWFWLSKRCPCAILF